MRRAPAATRSGGLVAVELQEVVGGGDQSPFRPARRSSAALEAVDPSVELRVSEYRLDQRGAFLVERLAGVGLKHAPHERVRAALPAGPWVFAVARVGRDQHL